MENEAPKEQSTPPGSGVERLTKAVELAYFHPWRMMGRSFLNGFMAALGATIGTALFFTILVWVFQALGGLELLRPGVEKLQTIVIPEEFRDAQQNQ